MNLHLKQIEDFLNNLPGFEDPSELDAIRTAIKALDRHVLVTEFKLERTEKVKRTTATLLEETINELEEKRASIEQSNAALKHSLKNLKATQEQLVQQEKLASLGQLTAGIAHEIKNPLNFVNNFSEVSAELIDEALDEVNVLEASAQKTELSNILQDVKSNLEKIHHHGSRADGIVQSMLLHSRGGSGEKTPTDLNDLLKEYVNLAFHGMRAGNNPINVQIDLELDQDLQKIQLIQEDFSRVILNLCNNAFDAMRMKLANSEQPYEPILGISTQAKDQQVILEIEDNGPGIPKKIKDKVLEPFFTTKKGTAGTGLGLSISNDIIKAHGGKMSIDSTPDQGTRFIIILQRNV